ncbi:hypothetical protein [Pectobacterium wasabiae]|uniref:Uncharacterized protein n=1 Tax=Pectobacterium wasabiae TaxID=55208 RepID=A0AAW3EB72_9GAMM|nr:hypothetical protein [Pectobacterium wasabiae]AOR65397.1 hypothetical protein A7983_19445 [Pectobacterium wasabiae CFBP 3304]EJS93171.1 Hypothetical protein Y17_3669 [Pectobacterium wasabiae CFBP 3304]KFX01460.1 hypothetical protein JV38_22325 [Pectobacterium wasabiae]KGA26345.1 hypothetical protein KU73_21985 [Pectobacterium wasabiae]
MKLTSEKSWADLCQERYLWAEESFVTFLQKFDAQRLIQSADNANRQVSVILYGPAQVGKTSLILTLLGIRDDCFTELNTLLRGEQGLGTMSTARTYRYRMAKDDFWYFSHREYGATRFSDKEAKVIFADFRQAVEQGEREFDSVDVFLPRRFFDPKLQSSAQLLIRDLPGTHSTNANEQYYVNMLASRYLASADVVLLTGKADALAFLKPEELDNALLNDWHWQRHRYKIVLTRAYSDATLQRFIKQKRFDKKAMRIFLLQQINTMDLGLPESISELIYPVECGHSWLAINAKDDEFARQCRDLRRDVLQDLLDSLHQASNPLSRLRSGYALPHIIKQQIAVEKELYETENALLQKQLSRLGEYVDMYEKRVSSNRDNHLRLQVKLQALLQKREDALSTDFREHSNAFQIISQSSLGYLKSQIYASRETNTKRWNDLLEIYQLPLERVPEMPNLERVLKRLNGYLFETYFREKTRQNDQYEIEEAGFKDANCLTYIFHERIKVKFGAEERALNNKIAKNERAACRLVRIVEQLSKKMVHTQSRLFQIKQELGVSLTLYFQRYKESKNFSKVIVSAKNTRAREIECNAKKPNITRSERLAWVLMYRALKNDFDYVKSLDEESTKVE